MSDIPASELKSKTKIRKVWRAMMYRCYSESCNDYRYYGGRGIKVDHRWHSFDCFFDDLKEIREGQTLDRIDNDGPYSKENVRLVDRKTQARNRRGGLNLNFLGEGETLIDIANKLELKYGTVYQRVKRGWDANDIQTKKFEPRKNRRNDRFFIVNGDKLSLKDVSEKYGIPLSLLKYRYKNGMAFDEVIVKKEVIKKPRVKVRKQKAQPKPKRPVREYIPIKGKRVMLTHKGKTQCLKDWADELGFSYKCITKRYQSGKTVEQILLPPSKKPLKTPQKRGWDFEGKFWDYKELALRFGIPEKSMKSRRDKGWDVTRAITQAVRTKDDRPTIIPRDTDGKSSERQGKERGVRCSEIPT